MTVEERVLSVITKETHREITAEQVDQSFDELGIDSLDRICILFGLEQEFSLSISEDEARQFSTVRQIVERLGQTQAPAASSASASA